jgi:pimeloyl-ACP methyl ester carboxylesterase
MTEAPAAHPPPHFEIAPHSGKRLAYLAVAGGGEGPTLVWLGGFRSDMRGTKAERLSDQAAREGHGFLRFDYSGHGESGGRFEDGTISSWTRDAETAIDTLAPDGTVILVGSSMGAWIALRLAQAWSDKAGRVAGLVLLAPAPDFTSRLLEPRLSEAQRAEIATKGFLAEPSPYDPRPTVYTKALIEDGRRASVLVGPIRTGCPVHIVQGMDDPDVPYAHALELVTHLPGEGVALTLVPGGDHRLSREEDLRRMERAVAEMAEQAQS